MYESVDKYRMEWAQEGDGAILDYSWRIYPSTLGNVASSPFAILPDTIFAILISLYLRSRHDRNCHFNNVGIVIYRRNVYYIT